MNLRSVTNALRGLFARDAGFTRLEEARLLQTASKQEKPVLHAVLATAIIDNNGTIVAEARDGKLVNSDGSEIGLGGGFYPDDVAPVNSTSPALSGTAQVGSEITCSTGIWTVGGGIAYSFQWQLDGVNVGVDSQTYTPTAPGDLQCLVTASNSAGEATEASDIFEIIDNGTLPVGGFLTQDGSYYFVGQDDSPFTSQ